MLVKINVSKKKTKLISKYLPGLQWQVKLAIPSEQFPPFWQGWFIQSSSFTSHFFPEKPMGHKHLKPLILSLQIPPLRQGFGEHSSISSSQWEPLYPID